ncbi:MAG: adenosylmethionine--8-amino-7-oxononanoate transaminase [Planctomycetota bacterium]
MNRQSDLAAKDKQHLWHPFTQMRDWAKEDPLIIESGEGEYLIDVAGRRYIDGVSSLWCNVHGHRVPAIDRRVREQLDKIAHSTFLGLSNVPAIELAEKLVGIAPRGLARVFYSDSGATSVEIALKMAFQYWRHVEGKDSPRKTFLALKNSYHGDTIGAVSLGGIELFHEIFRPLLFNAHFAPSPYCYRCPLDLARESCGMACAGEFEKLLEAHHREIAAVIVEPLVQGAGGMIVAPPGYLRRVREAAARAGALFIADEVAVGFGRTGKMFACEHEGVTPDIMTVAKGITGGYLPLAATLATEKIYGAFLGEYTEFKTFFHGHTYTANPLACAAALGSLEVFETDRTLAKLAPKIERLAAGLARFRNLPHVGDIRQRGMMAGIELVAARATKAEYPPAEKIGIRVVQETRKRGAVIRPLGNVMVVMPPLSIREAVLEELLSILYDAIQGVTEREGDMNRKPGATRRDRFVSPDGMGFRGGGNL